MKQTAKSLGVNIIPLLHRSKSHKIVLEETQVNVSAADEKGGLHQWNTSHVDVRVSGPYGLQYVDPAPIASRVVSADALEGGLIFLIGFSVFTSHLLLCM